MEVILAKKNIFKNDNHKCHIDRKGSQFVHFHGMVIVSMGCIPKAFQHPPNKKSPGRNKHEKTHGP
jgi:hypothetical protein